MRLSAFLMLALCTALLAGCGHSTPAVSVVNGTSTATGALAQLDASPTNATTEGSSATPTAAHAGQQAGWNAARWQKLFTQLPVPPATLAQAGAMIGLVRDADHGDFQLGPAKGALATSRAQYHAGMAAIKAEEAAHATAALGGATNSAHMQQLAQKMANAPRAEQIQMAMQMAASMQRPSTGGMAGMQTGAAVTGYAIGQMAQANAIHASLRKAINTLEAKADAQHASVNAAFQQRLDDCPPIPYCGDTTDCPPQPACIKRLNTRIPALLAQHRQIAQTELTAERTAYLHAQSALGPFMAKMAALTTTAEQAHALPSQVMSGYAQLSSNIDLLQTTDALIVSRAGFWQGIRAQPVADVFYIKGGGPLPYGNSIDTSAGTLVAPPSAAPSGW